METLPRKLTPDLLKFCASISAQRPKMVRSKPFIGAKLHHCFENVERKIAQSGGTIEYGWAIWHLPRVYFEAEHHGVWRRRNGELRDVSPQFNGYKKVLFLPDPGARYDPESFRSNQITPDGLDPRSVEAVGLLKERNEILDDRRRRGALGPDVASQAEANRLTSSAMHLIGSILSSA